MTLFSALFNMDVHARSCRPSVLFTIIIGLLPLLAGCGGSAGPSDPLADEVRGIRQAERQYRQSGDSADAAGFREAIGHQTPALRAAAARSAAAAGDHASGEQLLKLLDDPDAAVRGQAASALVQLTGVDPGYDAHDPPEKRKRAAILFKKLLDNLRTSPAVQANSVEEAT